MVWSVLCVKAKATAEPNIDSGSATDKHHCQNKSYTLQTDSLFTLQKGGDSTNI